MTIGTQHFHLSLTRRWQGVLKNVPGAFSRVVLNDENSVSLASLIFSCPLPQQILSRFRQLLQEGLGGCLPTALLVSFGPAFLLTTYDGGFHFRICVHRNDFEIRLRKFIVIVVVWQPVMLSEMRSVWILVQIELMTRIGLATNDLPRKQMWAKGMRIAVPKVMIPIPMKGST